MNNAVNRLYKELQKEVEGIEKAFDNEEMYTDPQWVREATIRLRWLTREFESHVDIEEADVHMDMETLHYEFKKVTRAIEANYQNDDCFTDLEWVGDTRKKLDSLTLEFSKTAIHLEKK